MSLGKQFDKIKKEQGGVMWSNIGAGVVSLALVYLLNLLWNWISPVWGLPTLSYLQFLSTLFLLHMLVQFLGFNAIKRDANSYSDVIELIGKPPYEEQ